MTPVATACPCARGASNAERPGTANAFPGLPFPAYELPLASRQLLAVRPSGPTLPSAAITSWVLPIGTLSP